MSILSSFWYFCDTCGYRDSNAQAGSTKTEAKQRAEKAGWKVSRGKATCPECLEESKPNN